MHKCKNLENLELDISIQDLNPTQLSSLQKLERYKITLHNDNTLDNKKIINLI